jgi:hypothetical protein
MRNTIKTLGVCLAVAAASSPAASLAASTFEGTWKVQDTAGKPFEITLSQNSAAKANRGEGMSGTWKEQGNTAVISWDTGWVTKIAKEGNRYKKTAYRKGQSPDSAPANSSDAEKTK